MSRTVHPDPSIKPIEPGNPAPDFLLSHSCREDLYLSSLRGEPVVLAFAPSEWDPSRREQLAQFNKILARTPQLPARLVDLSDDGLWYQLNFEGEQVALPLVRGLDPSGDTARAYGVEGRQALVLIDADGLVRWRHVAPAGTSIRPDDLLAALQTLAPALAPDAPAERKPFVLSRREFMAAALGVAFALALPHTARAQVAPADGAPEPDSAPFAPAVDSDPNAMAVTLRINGADHALTIDPRVTLLDALRDRLAMTGSKKGCDHGQCGACTVHLDGRRINSCLKLAVACQGKQIVTIEGLANGSDLHPMQAAFIEHDGFQCGYCTPGQIMSAVALLSEPIGESDADIREAMSGNICRCGAYPNILAAVQDVRKRGAS